MFLVLIFCVQSHAVVRIYCQHKATSMAAKSKCDCLQHAETGLACYQKMRHSRSSSPASIAVICCVSGCEMHHFLKRTDQTLGMKT